MDKENSSDALLLSESHNLIKPKGSYTVNPTLYSGLMENPLWGVKVQALSTLKENVKGVKGLFLLRRGEVIEADTEKNIPYVTERINRMKELLCKYKEDIVRIQILGKDSLLVFFCNEMTLGICAAPETSIPLLTFVVENILKDAQPSTGEKFQNLERKVKCISAEDIIDQFRQDEGHLRVYEIHPALLDHVIETVYFKECLKISTSESPFKEILKALSACSHTGTIYILEEEQFHILKMEDGNLKEAFFWDKKTVIQGIEAFYRLFSLDKEMELIITEKIEYPFGEWFIFLANNLFEKFSSLYGRILTEKMIEEINNFMNRRKYDNISMKEGYFEVASTFEVNLYPQYCEILKEQLSLMGDVMGVSTVKSMFDSLVSKLDKNGQFFFKDVIL